VLASGNAGKLRELHQLLGLDLVSQGELGVAEAEETGHTFLDNALLKARNACRHTGLAAIADDSGLEVDALNGAPGVYSARYAGPGADDDANNRLLLRALSGVPTAARGARFRCVLVYLRHADDQAPLIAEGCWEGRITTDPRGSHGFGYDPLFYLQEHG